VDIRLPGLLWCCQASHDFPLISRLPMCFWHTVSAAKAPEISTGLTLKRQLGEPFSFRYRFLFFL
jgi:hypothetical protein